MEELLTFAHATGTLAVTELDGTYFVVMYGNFYEPLDFFEDFESAKNLWCQRRCELQRALMLYQTDPN